MKFTFRKDARPTGLASVGSPYPNTDIKMNKQKIGYISGPNWRTQNKWTVRYAEPQE